MKTTKTLMMISLVGMTSLMLLSCGEESNVEEQQTPIRLTTVAQKAETRTTSQGIQLTQFAANAQVGIFLVEDVNGTPTLTGQDVTSYNQPLTYRADGSGNLYNTQYWPTSGNGLFIYGIFPADAAQAYTDAGVTFTVKADQSGEANYMASDLMTGVGPTTSGIVVPGQTVLAGSDFIKVVTASNKTFIYEMGSDTEITKGSVFTYNLTVRGTGIELSGASITAWDPVGPVNGIAELQ